MNNPHVLDLQYLHATYGSKVLTLATLLVGDKQVAEELMVNTFVEVHQKWHTFDPQQQDIQTFILQVTHRLCLKYLSQQRERPTLQVKWDAKQGRFVKNPS
ncbi:RNA polymerase sigma factor [Deinococcus cellulosilyticus]|nr:sigma factor [Deinococcus cellulosilyticus]